MKIYISLPISGQDKGLVAATARRAENVITDKGHTAVNPLSIPSPEETYASHMGADIAALLECDAIVLLRSWESSKGCGLELAAARIYGKAVFYNLQEIPTI